mmetsp:Transcript_69726/g.154294  ORF Transcript_69726/g.154294 Transcript_69726/m.154294 type:complete len:127 (+) Transcript_69726:344-724(+)
MMLFLLQRYARAAAAGKSWLPVLLQLVAAVFMLVFPMKEFVEGELSKGFDKKPCKPPPFPQGLFHNGVLMPAFNAIGTVLTVAASIAGSGLCRKVKLAMHRKSAQTEELMDFYRLEHGSGEGFLRV